MARKKNKNKRRLSKPAPVARFAPGTQVRVKTGTTDPDFPDIPLGGWSGTIIDVDAQSSPPIYLIEWDQRTLQAMHPIYCKRCERDDLTVENMWLGEVDLEADRGEPGPIEQPTRIVTRPLRMTDQDDRIRAILGLTSDDPLPEVDLANHRRYHEHLAAHLTFPFQASYWEETGPFEGRKIRLTVTDLLDFEECDEEEGLLCEALEQSEEAVVPLMILANISSSSNRRQIEDYDYWFCNWQGDVSSDGRGAAFQAGTAVDTDSPRMPLIMFLTTCPVGALAGAVLGAALATLEGAALAVRIGAILLAIVGGLLGVFFGALFGAVNRIRQGRWLCGVTGATLGAILGGLLGAMLIAFLGAVLGGVLGGILRKVIGRKLQQFMIPGLGVFAGALFGVLLQAWLQSSADAWSGAWRGGLAGAVAGPVLYFAWGVALLLLDDERPGS